MPTLRADVITKRNTTFIDKCSSEQVARGLNGALVRLLSTKLRSHAGVGLRTTGYVLNSCKESFGDWMREGYESFYLVVKCGYGCNSWNCFGSSITVVEGSMTASSGDEEELRFSDSSCVSSNFSIASSGASDASVAVSVGGHISFL